MKRIYITLLLLSTCLLQTFAVSEAEYKKLSKTYTVNDDGSQEYRYSMELTLFTHTAMNRTYGESFIVYNPAFQELKIHASYTKQKDGTIIRTPENAFVEVLPRQAAKAPAFNHLKEMVVVHTGLELGATIFLDYSVLSKPGHLPVLDICETIAQTSPVKDYTITIRMPENKPLFYELSNSNVKPNIATANGTKEVVWRIQNLPAASRSPQVSTLGGDVVLLTASGFASNDDAMACLNKQLTPTDDASAKELLKTVMQGPHTETDKLHSILNYVTDHVDNCALSLKETDYRLRPVDELKVSAYGTHAEKVNLLAALLNAAGIKAEVAAAYLNRAKINSCGLSAIDELFVVATVDGQQHLLSPQRKTPADAGRYAGFAKYANVSNPGQNLTIVPPSTELNHAYTIHMHPEKAEIQAIAKTGSAFIPYTSNYATNFTAKDKDGKEEKGDGFSIFTYSTVQPLKNTDRYIVYSLPDATDGFAHAPYKSYNTKRSEHLLLPHKAKESYIYTIHLPEHIELKTPPSIQTIDNKAGIMTFSIKQNGSTVEVTRTLEIKKQLIAPADYADFRFLMTEWAGNDQLLFFVDYTTIEKK